jgi:cell wall-associated NlpC family hydrolase
VTGPRAWKALTASLAITFASSVFAVIAGVASASAATAAEAAVPAVVAAPAATASLTAVRALAAPRHSATYYAWHFAQSQSGKPYEWGATGPGGYDCSGLVYAAYKAAGITLPRDTYEMLATAGRVLIPTSHPSTGNLAFYGSGHVELYVRPGVTYGAQTSGIPVGYHDAGGWWKPTAYFKVAGAG